jgi:hypothetical protein
VAADLVDGSGVVDFGSVFAGATSQLTLRVKNVGSGMISLSPPTLTGPFTLVSGPASTTLSANDGAVGGADETTFILALDTFTGGSKSGMLSLVNSDADEHAGELTAGEFSPQPWQLPVLSIPGVRRLDLTDLAWDGSELLSLKPSRGTGSGGDETGDGRSAVAGLTARQASEAALLAWADEDVDEFLTALRRNDEDEHPDRVDRVFEGFGDGGLAPLTWATEDRPRNIEKR